MDTNKEDLLLQIKETKSNLGKALITGNKRVTEQVSVQCACTLSILCTIQYSSPSQPHMYILSSGESRLHFKVGRQRGRVVRALDMKSVGHGFKSRSNR